MNLRARLLMPVTALTLAVAGLSSGGSRPAGAIEVDRQVAQEQAKRTATIAKARAATVCIFATDGSNGGSGVLISADGYALSNFHVTSACGDWMRCGLDDGKLYEAVIVGIDPVGDVALIKLIGRDDFPVAPLGDSDHVRAGDWAFVCGNPFLLASDFVPTVTYGLISGVRRYQYPEGTLLEYADCIQTDAAINPGNSGGPLFDRQGRVIGIVGRGSFEKRGRVNVGVGYAISINQIKHFLGHLRGGWIVDHATLGAVASTDKGRVLVDEILTDSDAYRRGLRTEDEIITLGGRPIRSANALKSVLGTYPKGWRVPLTYRRGGQRHETFVRLAGVHRSAELLELLQGEKRPSRKPQPKPPEGKPGEQPPEKEKPQKPDAPDGDDDAPNAAPLPAHLKKYFIARPGFANYYFNRLERQRVWKALAAHGDFSSLRGTWSLAGQFQSPHGATQSGRGELVLTDKEGICDLPAGQTHVDFGRQLGASLEPPGSGGLLVALHLWRRLLTLGPEKFGQVQYLGTLPLAGRKDLADVLTATYDGVECLFFCDRADGRLLRLEMFPGEAVDPCVVLLHDYQPQAGRQVPQRLEVRHGDVEFGMWQVKQFKLNPAQP